VLLVLVGLECCSQGTEGRSVSFIVALCRGVATVLQGLMSSFYYRPSSVNPAVVAAAVVGSSWIGYVSEPIERQRSCL